MHGAWCMVSGLTTPFLSQFVCAPEATWLILEDHGWDKARQDVPDTSETEVLNVPLQGSLPYTLPTDVEDADRLSSLG